MARYATGRLAWGYSDRSGFRYRLREMRKEWNGLKVGPDEYEAKHPQLEPNYPGPDPTALYEPRTDQRTEHNAEQNSAEQNRGQKREQNRERQRQQTEQNRTEHTEESTQHRTEHTQQRTEK